MGLMTHLSLSCPQAQNKDQGIGCYPSLEMLGDVFNAFHTVGTQWVFTE